MSADATMPSSDAPATDSGLRCPKCEYNLTGVAEDRCPECGGTFDRERLEAMLGGAPAPIPVWDDKSVHVVVRFVHVCLLTWFAPHELSRRFPRRYDFRSAKRFRWLAVLVSTLVWIVPLAHVLDVGLLTALVVSGVAYLAGIVTCEALLTGIPDYFFPAEEGKKTIPGYPTSSDSPAGFFGMFRSFVVLESLATAMVAMFGTIFVGALPAFLVLGVALWWWVALAVAIAVQPGPVRGKVGAILYILFPVLVSVFVAFIVGAAEVLLIRTVATLLM